MAPECVASSIYGNIPVYIPRIRGGARRIVNRRPLSQAVASQCNVARRCDIDIVNHALGCISSTAQPAIKLSIALFSFVILPLSPPKARRDVRLAKKDKQMKKSTLMPIPKAYSVGSDPPKVRLFGSNWQLPEPLS